MRRAIMLHCCRTSSVSVSESSPCTHCRNALSKAVYPASAARARGPSTGNPAAIAMFPARFRNSCTPVSTIPTASRTTPPNSGCCEDSTVRFKSSTSSTVVSTTASLLPYSTPNECSRTGKSPILTLSNHRNVRGRSDSEGPSLCSFPACSSATKVGNPRHSARAGSCLRGM